MSKKNLILSKLLLFICVPVLLILTAGLTILFIFNFVDQFELFFQNIKLHMPYGTLEQWTNTATYLSCIVSLGNLITFMYLTIKANSFQSDFSNKQIDLEKIKTLANFRMQCLNEYKSCLESLYDITRLGFDENCTSENFEALQQLRRKLFLFEQSSNRFFTINNEINEIDDEIEILQSELHNCDENKYWDRMEKINSLIIGSKIKFWDEHIKKLMEGDAI